MGFVVVIFGTEQKYVETEAKKYFELISSLRRKIQKLLKRKAKSFVRMFIEKGNQRIQIYAIKRFIEIEFIMKWMKEEESNEKVRKKTQSIKKEEGASLRIHNNSEPEKLLHKVCPFFWLNQPFLADGWLNLQNI